ncbi:bifunctional peptidase and arginyl-hydroxylase JMJD5 [Halyomorpha halys]|uniref:bifunctional peptidase and arginyl-hydroxylase JMJD5 n=1 Tax=Halyomorpha halys TaxID=286706 RepID=UPI0006D4D576|nr:jmjC domain-containing protein 5-like [Halyomorpha halys]
MDQRESLESIFISLKKYLSEDGLVQMSDVDQSIIYKLNVSHKNIINNNRSPHVLKDIQAVLDVVWEDLNTGHWSTVSEKHRKIYALGSLFKVIRIIQELLNENIHLNEHLKEAIKAADMGLLMGTGYHQELSNAARMLSNLVLNEGFSQRPDLFPSFSPKNENSDWNFSGIEGKIIDCLECPSLEYFFKHYFSLRVPVKLKECISHWPAFEKWKDVNYLIKTVGPRMVPIELGSSYVQNDWSMKLTTFQDFFSNYISQKNDSVGYLAQHQLFDQVPELKRDILIPEYCCLSDSEDNVCDVDINAWFGPAGTVSPLHFDPKHNLLSQVIGRKRVILYSPEDSDKLYPHETKMLHNTARVDPYNPNYEEYPEFKKSTALECHLYPGEMLYIPPKWWHHVRSLDISFSVSFWWE